MLLLGIALGCAQVPEAAMVATSTAAALFAASALGLPVVRALEGLEARARELEARLPAQGE